MAVAHKVQIGTVSHGTLRTEDLVDTFESELRFYAPDTLAQIEAEHGDAGFDAEGEIEDHEAAGYYLEALTEALEALAPDFCYFGNLEGDGSDFGFWPDMDRIQDVIDGGTRDPQDAETVINVEEGVRIHVNDHGNLSIYRISDDAEILSIV